MDTAGAFAARALAGGAGAGVWPTDESGGVDGSELARGRTGAEVGALVIGGTVGSGVPVDVLPVVPTLSGVVVPMVDPVAGGAGAADDPVAVVPGVVAAAVPVGAASPPVLPADVPVADVVVIVLPGVSGDVTGGFGVGVAADVVVAGAELVLVVLVCAAVCSDAARIGVAQVSRTIAAAQRWVAAASRCFIVSLPWSLVRPQAVGGDRPVGTRGSNVVLR